MRLHTERAASVSKRRSTVRAERVVLKRIDPVGDVQVRTIRVVDVEPNRFLQGLDELAERFAGRVAPRQLRRLRPERIRFAIPVDNDVEFQRLSRPFSAKARS